MLVVSAAFFVRAAYLAAARSSPFFELLFVDAHGYWEWSGHIASGNWLGERAFYQAPLYPYFLGLARALGADSTFAVRVLQALLGSLACGLVFLAGRDFFSRPAGLAAAALLSVYAPAIFLGAQLQKGALSLFLTALLCFALARAARPRADSQRGPGSGAGLVGVTLGLLALTREEARLFVPVWIGWLAYQRSRTPFPALRSLAAFLAGLALVLAPVAWRNLRVAGDALITTAQAGPNFYIGNHPGADGTYAPLRAGRGDTRYERDDAESLAEAALGRELTPREVSQFWFGRALSYVRDQPGAWLALLGRKLLLALNTHEIGDAESQVFQEREVPLLGRLASLANFGLLLPLGVLGLWLSRGRTGRRGALLALGATQLAALVTFYVFARYRLPLVVVLTLFAGQALVALWGLLRQRAWPRLALGLLLGVGAGVLAHLPLVPATTGLATSHANVAAAYYALGDEPAFRQHSLLAIELGSRQARVNLGVAEARAGRAGEAAQLFEQARAAAPADPRLLKRLGTALGEAHNWPVAAEHLARSYELDPDDPETASNLFYALRELERWSELERQLDTHLIRHPADAGARALREELRAARETPGTSGSR